LEAVKKVVKLAKTCPNLMIMQLIH